MEKYYGGYSFYKQKYNKRNYDMKSQTKFLMNIVDLLLQKGYGQIDSSINKNYGNKELIKTRYEINELENIYEFMTDTEFKFDGISLEDMDLIRSLLDSDKEIVRWDKGQPNPQCFDRNLSIRLYENEKEYHEYNNYEYIIIKFSKDIFNQYIIEERIEKEKTELEQILISGNKKIKKRL